MTARRVKWAVLVLLVGVVAACAKDPLSRYRKAPGVLALVGRYIVTRKDFDRTLDFNQAGDTRDDLIQSRIWDGMVDDILVLNVIAPLPAPKQPVPLGEFSDPVRRQEAVSQVLEERVYAKTRIYPKEVADYYQSHLKSYERGKGVLLRQMLLTGVKQVNEAGSLLARGHSFLDVARLYSSSPDRGQTQYFEDTELPDYLRSTIRRLRAGGVSKPIEVSSDSYQIVMLVKRCNSYTLPLSDVAPLIRLKLADREGGRRLSQYLAGLRKEYRVVVFLSKLPFAYRKEPK
jgi:hypothetical protein